MGDELDYLKPQARCSRRRFMGLAAASAAGCAFSSLAAAAAQFRSAGRTGRLHLRPGTPPSRVVQIENEHVTDGAIVHRDLLHEMLDQALLSLTGKSGPNEVWRTILKADDVIGLKFNQSGQEQLNTTRTLAPVLIQSLLDAGWSPRQIVCIEAPEGIEETFGTTSAVTGFDRRSTDFGSGTDELASVLGQITALIDVPFLKTHNIAGITCSLKNLSHAMVKHPARYHANGCSPYIADIVANTPIRGKLRLCLVDALRTVYAGGPVPRPESTADTGVLLASFDPVACDVVGLSVLNDVRRQQNLPSVARSPEEIDYLAEAHRRGVGVAVWHGIELSRIRF